MGADILTVDECRCWRQGTASIHGLGRAGRLDEMRRAITAYMERSSHGFRRRIPGLVRLAYRAGREPVPIDDLVSPLRYDILVRQRYLEALREHRSLADEDFAAFMELSRRQPYYTWFTRVVVPHGNHPEIAHDEERLDAAFERRVRRSVALHDSFESGGYDKRRPIILRSGTEITPTSTGKRLARRLFAGDGCHRLAWLRLTGLKALEPGMYRVHVAPVHTPKDETARLLEAMPISRDEYFAFVSLSYADRELSSEEALLDHVRSTAPARLPELEGLIAVDAPLLAAAARSA
jgi:hypothetical protein